MHQMRLLGVLAVTGLLFGGCGDDSTGSTDGDESSTADKETTSSDSDSATPDVTAACDVLENLGELVLEVQQEGIDTEEDVVAVSRRFHDFLIAATNSGDSSLEELAGTAEEAFSTYVTASNEIDSQEARNEADIALDRAAARCLELGATNEFPEEPAS